MTCARHWIKASSSTKSGWKRRPGARAGSGKGYSPTATSLLLYPFYFPLSPNFYSLFPTCQIHAEPVPFVAPGLPDSEAGALYDCRDALRCEFVTVFGMDAFAAREAHFQLKSGDGHLLRHHAVEVNLDPRSFHVPFGAVPEEAGVEVCAQLTVDASQDVLVKRCRYPRGIVVGAQQRCLVLDVIHAEQQQVAGAEPAPHFAQDLHRVRWLEIAYAGAYIEHHAAASGSRNLRDALGVVGHARVDLHARNLCFEMFLRRRERAFVNIDGHVIDRALPAHGLLEQQTGFFRGTRAQLNHDERRVPRTFQNFGCVARENSPLGAREVVLRQAGDGLEQVRARLIIKEPW